MFKITKDFTDIHYGHRVWTQKLRENLCASGDTQCACRHLHGHSGSASLTVQAPDLNPQGMVCDFKELGFMKDFLNTYFDHRFVLDVNDPAFLRITGLDKLMYAKYAVPVVLNDKLLGYEIDPVVKTLLSLDESEFEVLSGFFFVDFIPTSENIASYLYEYAKHVLSPYNIQVLCLKWKETEKSKAVYFTDLKQV